MINTDKAHGAYILKWECVCICIFMYCCMYDACTHDHVQMIGVVFRSRCLFIAQMFILILSLGIIEFRDLRRGKQGENF